MPSSVPDIITSKSSRSSNVSTMTSFGVITEAGKICKYCIQTPGGYCELHVNQKYKHPKAMAKGSLVNVKKSCSQITVDTIFGITGTHEPCKKCIKKQDFCHHHTEQRDEGPIVLSDKMKQLLMKSMHVDNACKIYGVTSAQEPCKRCIKQGDFCHQHTKQRYRGSIDLYKFVDRQSMETKKVVSGKKKDGQMCKNCLDYDSGFCHQHQKQREVLLEEEIVAETVASSASSLPKGSQRRGAVSRRHYRY